MKKENMKVFHGLVNYGTQAGLLAKGLRDVGIEAYSVAQADNFRRLIDLDLRYDTNSNIFVRLVQRFWVKFSSFFKYNVFHFYFGKSLWPYNIDLYLYKLIGKKVVMEYLGTDCNLWLGLNGVDFRNRPVDRVKIIKMIKLQSKLCHKQLVCAPRYYELVDNSIVLPLALDLTDYAYTPMPNNQILTFMHCPTNRIAKKSDYIEQAINKLREEGYQFNYKCITNVTHAELKEEYKSADVVIDQLNTWYGTVSVEAMALGRPVVCGYYPHMCHYDKRFEKLPIINADIFNIYNVLKDILDGKYDLQKISKASRDFAVKTHDLKSVTSQLIDIYESL